jgi:hypothetical protein
MNFTYTEEKEDGVVEGRSLYVYVEINSVREKIKIKWTSGNACCSCMTLFSSCLLFRNINIKIYRTTVAPVFLYGCETWVLTLREERRLRV